MSFRTFVAMLVLVALAGCGTSPPVRYFNLEPLNDKFVDDAEDSPVLGLGPIRLPEYLQRNQVVTRGKNAEMIVDNYQRWAEPLDVSMHRIVAANVDALLDGAIVISFPYNATFGYDYRLVGRIDRFDADSTGQTVLSVHWAITDLDGGLVTQPRRSRFVEQAANTQDAGSVARAMSRCLVKYSKEIAEAFEAVISEQSG